MATELKDYIKCYDDLITLEDDNVVDVNFDYQ